MRKTETRKYKLRHPINVIDGSEDTPRHQIMMDTLDEDIMNGYQEDYKYFGRSKDDGGVEANMSMRLLYDENKRYDSDAESDELEITYEWDE